VVGFTACSASLLLPFARWANTYTMLNGHMVFFYYLPLALVLSLMMFFGWAAIPGIIIGLLLTLARMTPEQAIGVLFHFYPLRAVLGRISHLCTPAPAGLAR
jgi:hypothetical protein